LTCARSCTRTGHTRVTHTHVRTCTEMHTNAHKPRHADTHADRNTYTQQAHTHTHACTRTRMHTGSHTHTTDTRAHTSRTCQTSLETSGASTNRRPWARECTAGVRVHRQGARMHRHDASMRMSMGVRTHCRKHPLLLKSFVTMGARTHRRCADAPSAKAPQRTASWRMNAPNANAHRAPPPTPLHTHATGCRCCQERCSHCISQRTRFSLSPPC